jgi:hypothetical protein
MNLDLNEELIEPDASETDTTEFEILSPLTPWDDVADTSLKGFDVDPDHDDTSYNSHGVVHVRMVCAQRLPCPVGSSVCASVALPPYKGRVKTRRKNAFLVSLEHGVCVQWTNPLDGNDYSTDDDDGLCSMVNGWSSKDSPVPSIRIDLMFSPLGMGLFDFTMATVELSCVVLLKNAGVWRERWVQMDIPSTMQGSGIENDRGNAYFHRCPLVKIQAVFTPSLPSSGESAGLLSFGGTSQIAPPPLDRPVIVIQSTSSNVTSPMHSEKPTNVDSNVEAKVRPPLARRASDETLSLSALDGVKSKTMLREVNNDVSHSIAEEEEDMTSIGIDSDTPLDDVVAGAGANLDDGSLHSKTNLTQSAIDPHLLRAETYWVPGSCAVCERVLIGMNGGFNCEECGIDCCSDCRLNVDIRVPCGSDKAQEFLEKTQQGKMSISGLLNYVAPDDTFEQKRIEEESMHSSRQKGSMLSTTDPTASRRLLESQEEISGIGCFHVEIITACLFRQVLPAWSATPFGENLKQDSLPALRKGDYYVRISTSGSHKTFRTPTLQNTGMPHFQSSEMSFSIQHYGVLFRIDVIEAETEKIVGSALLTTQGLLQEQRDRYIAEHGASLLQFMKGPIPWGGKQSLKLDLRSGIKPGLTADYYSAPAKGSSEKGESEPGAICGWIEIGVGIEEYVSKLYGSNPIECPERPPPDLNMSNFSLYHSRIKAIISDLNHAFAHYNYLISWKNPMLTGVSLYVFVWFCLSFNAEYSGSLPFLFLLVLATYCCYQRDHGKSKNRFICKELESIQRIEGGSVGYKIYRPKGILSVAVMKGRNLANPDLGISGRVSCEVYFDGVRYADKETREKILRADKSAEVPLEIGQTPVLYTAHPDWKEIRESTTIKRLKQLIPSSDRSFFESSSSMHDEEPLQELSFPVLHPFEVLGQGKDNNGHFVDAKLKSWNSSKGAIVVQVKFQDFLNNLPGFHHILGEVVFPFANLARIGEVSGWFKILEVGTNLVVPLDDHDLDGEQVEGTSGPPRVYLSLKWTPPRHSSIVDPDDSEKELSYVIQEELVRSSRLLKENKFDLVGSSIGAVNTALGIGGTVQIVQNTLGSVLDCMEAAINAFNFTDPFKSSVIFGGLFVVWLVLILIPTRYIILGAGFAQYAVTFVARFGEDLGFISTKRRMSEATPFTRTGLSPAQSKGRKVESPIVVWIMNALRSLPTNEDLRKAYFWESRRLGAKQAEKHASDKRESRLKKLWKATWHSPVVLLIQNQKRDQHQGTHLLYHKKSCFAVIQGHRFIWWNSVRDFDDGELPEGKLLLSGHAGIGGPSPLEMRDLSKEELSLCLSIFGRGGAGQQKVVMILPESATKEALEKAVSGCASFKSD